MVQNRNGIYLSIQKRKKITDVIHHTRVSNVTVDTLVLNIIINIISKKVGGVAQW